MLCFDKLAGEHNNKNTLLNCYVLWEYTFKVKQKRFYEVI